MIKLAANVDWLWKELPLSTRVEYASKAGFLYLESLNPYAHDVHVWHELLDAHQVELVLVNAPPGSSKDQKVKGLAAWPSKEQEFQSCFSIALDYAETLHVPLIHATSGPVLHDPNWQTQQETYVENLRWACSQAVMKGITVTIEPLSPRDAPGSFMASLSHALETIALVNQPNLKLQFDLYHQQILHGDIITKLREHFGLIGHIQIAGVPDRTEPDLGELNAGRVFNELQALGYSGFIGCEYRPAGPTPEAGLGWAKPYLKSN